MTDGVGTAADVRPHHKEEAMLDEPKTVKSHPFPSRLALLGLGVSVLYVLIVLAKGAIALVNHIPWLLPAWTFVIAIAALVLCGMARIQIRHSEGALSGLAISTWGLRLTILIGFPYAAYYGSTYFRVRSQAIDCADHFFEQIKQGRINRAFLLGMGVRVSDEDEAALRDVLEIRFNSFPAQHMRGGPYTRFRSSDFVRLIQASGMEARIAPLEILAWDYKEGHYEVAIKYQVATPLAEFAMQVQAVGEDSKPSESKGRNWHVLFRDGQTHTQSGTMKLTPYGEEWMQNGKEARRFVLAWQNKLHQQRWGEVYLDTLKPAERERLRRGQQLARLRPMAPLIGLAPLALHEAIHAEYMAGAQKFKEGKLLCIDDKKFWTKKSERGVILERIRRTFQPSPDGKPTLHFLLQEAPIPQWRTDKGELLILFDAAIAYRDETTYLPKYVVEVQVAVGREEGEANRSMNPWRIHSIELIGGRSMMSPPETANPERWMGAQ
jgi:hypothetical protein